MRFMPSIMILSFFTSLIPVFGAEPTAREVIDKMENRIYGDTFHSKLEIQIERPRFKRSLTVESWDDSKKDKSFIKILKPKRDQGVTFLKDKNNLWQYIPSIGKEIKIEGSLMQDSWMGSDFTNDDLMRTSTLSDDYTHKFLTSTDNSIYRIELRPLPTAAVVWSRIVVDVKKNGYLPTKQEFFDHKDRLKKRMVFQDYRRVDNRIIPTKYIMYTIENDRTVSTTAMMFLNIKFDMAIPAGIFSKANLRR